MQNQQKGKQDGPRFNFSWLYFIIIAGLIFLIFSRDSSSGSSKSLAYSDFQECVDSGYVQNITIDRNSGTLMFNVNTQGERHIFGDVKKGNSERKNLEVEIGSIEKFEEFSSAKKEQGLYKGKVKYEHSDDTFMHILWQVLFFVGIIVFWFFIMNRISG